jgi:hypothetical protein
MVIKRDGVIGFIYGHPNVRPTNIHGYDEVHKTNYN